MIKKEKTFGIRALYHLAAIVFLFIVASIYFAPFFEGKVLVQSDVTQFQGMSQELRDYYYNEGKTSEWTGAMFSGMPSYQIGVWGGSPNFLNYVEYPIKALGGSTVGPVFMGMLAAYILFCLMGVGIIPAIIGALAYSFSSYNIIILDAGHITKAWAIAYIPLVLAAFVTAYKNKYLLSALLMSLGLALEIKSNHLQITYYLAILCAILYLGLLVHFILSNNIKALVKTTIALGLGIAIAVLSNLGNLYANYEMSKESVRGKSELTQPTQSEKQSSGLDKEYAFAWSYGKVETLSLLVPDIYGGASGSMLSPDSHLYKEIKAKYPATQLDSKGIQAQTYWGDQPFTSGPVYFGAIICFLFVLGMFIIKNRIKWLIFGATVFFILLSWGHNLEFFNDWFFYHFPLYNKFRAVSSALVIPAITVLIVAIWGLSSLLDNITEKKRLFKAIYISAAITGGICLLLIIVPNLFGLNFISANDTQWLSSVPDWYYKALIADRRDLLTSDAFRSLIFIVLAALTLLVFVRLGDKNKIKLAAGIVLILLIIMDLLAVDKRYLNNDKFQTKIVNSQSNFFNKTQVDKIILEDKEPSYRVLNLNNPFNETRTSYFHKSIGGYHAAKLKRYQELIDYNLQGELNNIIKSFDTQNIDSITASFKENTALNMLNTKYIIFSTDQPPLVNPYAMGNAWFVSDYKLVDNADQELAALNNTDLHKTAIVDKKFEADLQGVNLVTDSAASIQMVEYKPNHLIYNASVNTEGLAVFSEIYYAKGWEAFIDGISVPHIRADWTLRALLVPKGNHVIEFKFIPHNYINSGLVTSIFSGLLLICLLGYVIVFLMKTNKKDKA